MQKTKFQQLGHRFPLPAHREQNILHPSLHWKQWPYSVCDCVKQQWHRLSGKWGFSSWEVGILQLPAPPPPKKKPCWSLLVNVIIINLVQTTKQWIVTVVHILEYDILVYWVVPLEIKSSQESWRKCSLNLPFFVHCYWSSVHARVCPHFTELPPASIHLLPVLLLLSRLDSTSFLPGACGFRVSLGSSASSAWHENWSIFPEALIRKQCVKQDETSSPFLEDSLQFPLCWQEAMLTLTNYEGLACEYGLFLFALLTNTTNAFLRYKLRWLLLQLFAASKVVHRGVLLVFFQM